jgi:hypothetical protein
MSWDSFEWRLQRLQFRPVIRTLALVVAAHRDPRLRASHVLEPMKSWRPGTTLALQPLAVALASLLAFSACAADLPNRWTDPTFGFEVRTDFKQYEVEAMFDKKLVRKFAALCALFEVTSLADLRISVHDHGKLPRGEDASVVGWHDSGEIHLMAHWDGTNLAMPDIATERNLEHEFAHALHARARLNAPRWLEEGLCEVLSASPVDASGQLVLMPDTEREVALRKLRAEGRWLTAPALLALRDGYPSDPDQLAPMYAEATSFTWYLLADCAHPTRATLAALVARSPEQLAEQFAAWEAQLGSTSIARLLTPFASSADPNTRLAVANALGNSNHDDAWWSLAASLLADPDVNVRASARIRAAYRPDGDPSSVAHLRAWRDSADRNLHLAGLGALAQCGDIDAAVQFCRTVGGTQDKEWEQPLCWMALILPADGSKTHAYPDLGLLFIEPNYLHEFASALADEYERLRPRVEWDPHAMRYRWR